MFALALVIIDEVGSVEGPDKAAMQQARTTASDYSDAMNLQEADGISRVWKETHSNTLQQQEEQETLEKQHHKGTTTAANVHAGPDGP